MAGRSGNAGAQAVSRALRVLSISTLYPNDLSPGFGIFVERQMQALVMRGDVEVEMWNPIGLPPWPLSQHPRYCHLRGLAAEESRGAITVFRPRFRLFPGIGGRFNAAAIARAVLAQVRARHDARAYDLVDAQFFFPDGPAAALVAKALGLPLSITARGTDIHLWGAKSHAQPQMLLAADQAAGMVAVSQALKQDMAALGMAADKISVRYTGLDHALFRVQPRAEARAAVSDIVSADGPLIVTVGNLIPLKGQNLVIEALASFPEAQLVLAGKGPEEASLRTLAKRLGVADRVHLPGSIAPARLAQLLSAANAMVLPSEREGLANAWVEALACGTPLVITDVGGAREVVKDPSAGRIVERKAEAIISAVRELLANPPAQAEVAAHAARYSWDGNAAEMSSFFHRIAGK